MGEIWESFRDPTIPDLHTRNQADFVLPDRNIAKRFTFKMLYGGTSFGFAVDNNFSHVSDSKDFWEKVIQKFYAKYIGVKSIHDKWVQEVVDTGKLVMPTGREYHFDRKDVVRRLWFWRPKILNYPVQGLGADLVAIARVGLRRKMKGSNAILVGTVHDSIDLDVPIRQDLPIDKSMQACYNICSLMKASIEDVPANFEKLFQVPFNVPLTGEVFYGPNLKDLTQYKRVNSAN